MPSLWLIPSTPGQAQEVAGVLLSLRVSLFPQPFVAWPGLWFAWHPLPDGSSTWARGPDRPPERCHLGRRQRRRQGGRSTVCCFGAETGCAARSQLTQFPCSQNSLGRQQQEVAELPEPSGGQGVWLLSGGPKHWGVTGSPGFLSTIEQGAQEPWK